MSRYFMKTGVAAPLIGIIVPFASGCTRPQAYSNAERHLIEANLPTDALILDWVGLDYPRTPPWSKDTFDRYRQVVNRVVDQVRKGIPVILEVPSPAPCFTERVEVDAWVPHPTGNGTTYDHFIERPFTYTESTFGLPAREIPDALPIGKGIELNAMRRTLQWFASKGVYPINSTKRRP